MKGSRTTLFTTFTDTCPVSHKNGPATQTSETDLDVGPGFSYDDARKEAQPATDVELSPFG